MKCMFEKSLKNDLNCCCLNWRSQSQHELLLFRKYLLQENSECVLSLGIFVFVFRVRVEATEKDRKTKPERHTELYRDLSPARHAGQQRTGPESSSGIQNSLGTTTFHALQGHFLFMSLYSHTPHECTAVGSREDCQCWNI